MNCLFCNQSCLSEENNVCLKCSTSGQEYNNMKTNKETLKNPKYNLGDEVIYQDVRSYGATTVGKINHIYYTEDLGWIYNGNILERFIIKSLKEIEDKYIMGYKDAFETKLKPVKEIRRLLLEDLKEKVEKLKVATQKETGSFKYDFAYDEVLEEIHSLTIYVKRSSVLLKDPSNNKNVYKNNGKKTTRLWN